MKRFFILLMIIPAVILMTGCSSSKGITKTDYKTLNCTIEETDEEDLTTDYEINYTFKNEAIYKLESNSIVEVDPELLEEIIKGSKDIIDQMALYEGFTYEVTKEDDSHIKGHIIIDYTKIDMDELTEQYGSDYVESESYLQYTTFTLEDLKSSMVEGGYTCK